MATDAKKESEGESFPKVNVENEVDGNDFPPLPLSNYPALRDTDEMAALQLQQELAAMKLQFQKEAEEQKRAHEDKMQEILKKQASEPATPKLDKEDFLNVFRQVKEMASRMEELESMVRESEEQSIQSLAKVEELKKEVEEVEAKPGGPERDSKQSGPRRSPRTTQRKGKSKRPTRQTIAQQRRRASYNFVKGSPKRAEALVLLGKIQAKMRRKRCAPSRLFQLMASNRRNSISYRQFVAGLAHIDVHLHPKDSKMVFNFLNRDGTSNLSREVFGEGIVKEDTAKRKQTVHRLVCTSSTILKTFGAKLKRIREKKRRGSALDRGKVIMSITKGKKLKKTKKSGAAAAAAASSDALTRGKVAMSITKGKALKKTRYLKSGFGDALVRGKVTMSIAKGKRLKKVKGAGGRRASITRAKVAMALRVPARRASLHHVAAPEAGPSDAIKSAFVADQKDK